MIPGELSREWRIRADQVRPWAAEVARAFEVAADELDAALRNEANEPLTLTQAAALTGMSADHVGRNRIAITYYDPVSLSPVTGTGSNVGGNIVVVSASGLSWAWMVPLLRSRAPLQFAVSSADIMEATPLAGAPTR